MKCLFEEVNIDKLGFVCFDSELTVLKVNECYVGIFRLECIMLWFESKIGSIVGLIDLFFCLFSVE